MFDRMGNRKYLNAKERRAFWQTTKNEPDALRRAFALTIYNTGCRISEALNVTTGRVDVANKSVVFETLKQRKGGHFRSVPIPDDLVDLLSQVMPSGNSSARVWSFSRPTGYRLIKDIMAKAGVTGGMATTKGLRHGFAIACLEQNIFLTTVRRWLGHARLETTSVYLEISGNEERELAKTPLEK